MSNDNKSNVVELDVITRLDLPPERVLKWALEEDLESVVIIGCRKNGHESKHGDEYFASSIAGGPEVVWMLERAKKKLLEMGDD